MHAKTVAKCHARTSRDSKSRWSLWIQSQAARQLWASTYMAFLHWICCPQCTAMRLRLVMVA
eukprot:4938866-Amphidinium_carterae.2